MHSQCAACRQSFVPRRNTARFCSANCRLTAHRSQNAAETPVKAPPARSLAFQAPTPSPTHATHFETLKTLQPEAFKWHSVTIVPDSKYPGMWRVKRPDGSISDMVNLSRAKDAAAAEAGAR
jgi:hypothetical protein